MSVDIKLEHSLLLTHGTIYGEVAADAPFKEFDGISASIVSGWAVPWRQDHYVVIVADPFLVGPLAEVVPIDVVSWNAGPGAVKESGMEIWQQCLTLFMRHI